MNRACENSSNAVPAIYFFRIARSCAMRRLAAGEPFLSLPVLRRVTFFRRVAGRRRATFFRVTFFLRRFLRAGFTACPNNCCVAGVCALNPAIPPGGMIGFFTV